MAGYAHTNRLLTLSTPLGADKLLAESFQCSEAISELFEISVEALATPDTTVTPADLIGKRLTLGLEVNDTGTLRNFNGMIASIESLGGDLDFNSYSLRVVPSVWLLTLNTQTRVFQNLSVLEIVKQVLTTYSITPTDDTQATYTTLGYCTQYRESDYHFISRLLAQHGIFFYFTHTASDHSMVLADASAQLSPCAVASTFRYASGHNTASGFYQPIVYQFSSRSTLTTGTHKLWDYRFSQYAASSSSTESATKSALGSNAHEFYDYADAPSAYLKTDSGDGNVVTLQTFMQNIGRDIHDAAGVAVTGESYASTMQAGFTFTLSEYPQGASNTKHLLTRVTHRARQRPSYRAEQTSNEPHYTNHFSAQPSSVVYRTPQLFSKPRVQGVVTGKVVAPSGDDSYLDKYGRVCVQFWWDRTRKPNTTDNTLLRVAQQWAGKGWGTYFWPRINDEVLIDFIDGDPDAPIVVGSLYNGTNMPHYDPAAQYTRSGILTQSSKNGVAANANELRFDDLKGSEQIFMNAEKDLDIHVENDWHNQVDKDHHLTVKGDHYDAITGSSHSKVTKDRFEEVAGASHLKVTGKHAEDIGGDSSEKIGGNHFHSVGGDAHNNVGGALNEKVGSTYSLQVGENHYSKAGMVYVVDSGQEVHIKGGMKVVIEGGMGVCMSGPGGFVSVGPTGVTISGIMVNINSGGAALQGSPGTPQSPQSPTAPTAPTAPSWPGDDPRK
ncbi:MAG: type VI secretion system Vgr family protein [Janthinobacterium lividum]